MTPEQKLEALFCDFMVWARATGPEIDRNHGPTVAHIKQLAVFGIELIKIFKAVE